MARRDPGSARLSIHERRASAVPDAAYRFVRHEPGVDVVLLGPGDPKHLRTNVASILKPPFPKPTTGG